MERIQVLFFGVTREIANCILGNSGPHLLTLRQQRNQRLSKTAYRARYIASYISNKNVVALSRCRVVATVVQEVEKWFSNQKVASSIPYRSILEQDTEPLIAPDVQCAISEIGGACV